MASFFPNNSSKPASERYAILDLNERESETVAVASAVLYANYLHLNP